MILFFTFLVFMLLGLPLFGIIRILCIHFLGLVSLIRGQRGGVLDA